MADQFKKRLSDPIELKLRATVEKWIIEDIGRVYDGTHSIKNPDLRSKSTLLLFKKRFEKAERMISVLSRNGLSDRTELFAELIELI